MADDIVERLRNTATCPQTDKWPSDLLFDAADRIVAQTGEISIQARAVRSLHSSMERTLAAEARVRELEAKLAKATDPEYLESALTKVGVVDKQAVAEAYERAAKEAESMPHLIPISPKHVRGLKGEDVATAIRKLAQEAS